MLSRRIWRRRHLKGLAGLPETSFCLRLFSWKRQGRPGLLAVTAPTFGLSPLCICAPFFIFLCQKRWLALRSPGLLMGGTAASAGTLCIRASSPEPPCAVSPTSPAAAALGACLFLAAELWSSCVFGHLTEGSCPLSLLNKFPQTRGTFQHKPRVPGESWASTRRWGNETHGGTVACPRRRGAGTGSSRTHTLAGHPHAALCCCRGRTLPPHWTLDPTQRDTGQAAGEGGGWMAAVFSTDMRMIKIIFVDTSRDHLDSF